MLGDLESGLEMGEVRGSIGGVGGSLNGWIVYQEGAETWFWGLGRDSPVLGRGSCEGSCIG